MDNIHEDSIAFASDFTSLKSENRTLKAKLRHVQSELTVEQGESLELSTLFACFNFYCYKQWSHTFSDTVAALRKKLNSTERERLDGMSRATEQVPHAHLWKFVLNIFVTDCVRVSSAGFSVRQRSDEAAFTVGAR